MSQPPLAASLELPRAACAEVVETDLTTRVTQANWSAEAELQTVSFFFSPVIFFPILYIW